MKKKSNILSKIKQWRKKHKLSFTDDVTYDEKWSFKLSALNMMSLLFFYSVILIVCVFLLIRFTPIKTIFVDNANLYELNQKLSENTAIINDLNKKIKIRDNYFKNLEVILNGGDFNDSLSTTKNQLDENFKPKFEQSADDSLLRYKMENTSNIKSKKVMNDIGFFMSPVSGRISKSIDITQKHFGVDVVTVKNEPIKATLEGLVVFSTWTSADGNVIILQHQNNIISVYKHCSVLLKQVGEHVEVGDPIAIVGNSGKFTDGPHLHFELWQKGIVLNPQEFIAF